MQKNLGIVKAVTKAINTSTCDRFWVNHLSGNGKPGTSSQAFIRNEWFHDHHYTDSRSMALKVEFGNHLKDTFHGFPS